MEKRYQEPEQERFVSEKVNLEQYFNEYGRMLLDTFPELKPKNKLSHLCGMSTDEMKYMEVCTNNLFPPESKPNPTNVSKPSNFKPELTASLPESAISSLKSLQIFEQRDAITEREVKKKLVYAGEVDLEDSVMENHEKYQSRVDLVPVGYYLLTVRVYLPVLHSKYTTAPRAKYLQVNQEFLCLSSGGLDVLRDRIACANDFQPMSGDISNDLLRPTTSRAGVSHQSALFYIGNDFYIDGRHPDNRDYSSVIVEWGKLEGFEFGKTLKMEHSTMADLKPIRLGYPYLYLHLGNCEHLCIITDARLLHPQDPLDSTKYPFLLSFATFKGRYCYTCRVKIARYLVVHNDRLPEDAAYTCRACLESFSYKNGQKIGDFKVYRYVDRTALF